MRDENIKTASNSIEFLNNQMQTTNLKELKELLSNKGETKINFIITDENKRAFFSLEESRKFDLNHLKALKAKKYVEKIIV